MNHKNLQKCLLVTGLILACSCFNASYANDKDAKSASPVPDANVAPAARQVERTPFIDFTSHVAPDGLETTLTAADASQASSPTTAEAKVALLPPLASEEEAKQLAADAAATDEGASQAADIPLALEETAIPEMLLDLIPADEAAPVVAAASAPSGSPGSKAKVAACATNVAAVGWLDCSGGCLRSWGVSPMSLILCGATCAFGVVPICAVCVGVTVTVLELCAIGCAIYGTQIAPVETQVRHKKLPGSDVAARTLQSARRAMYAPLALSN
ncbi:MAG TPA: hypothetical protein VEZ40_02815 [Pyrinomonadaceae bacterium]|nr:hypothetical protein [Pyrinomonadaceae bacterium]